MKKYEQYIKILNDIKIIANLNPSNVAGCEFSLSLIDEKVREAKKVKIGLT